MLIYEEVCIVLYGGSFMATNYDSRLVDCLLFEKLLAVAEAFPIFEDIKLLFEILEARFTLGEYIIFGDEKWTWALGDDNDFTLGEFNSL